MSRLIDRTGNTYNDLVVIGKSGEKNKVGVFLWACLCKCGNYTLATSEQLKTGKKKSCGCRKNLPKGEASFNSLLGIYQRGAKYRNLEFRLTKDEFRSFTKGNCYFCGKTPDNNHQSNGCKGHYVYNGVDRLDNSKGYVVDNCVSCCTYCNRAKNNRTENEFLTWISSVFVHAIQMNKAV